LANWINQCRSAFYFKEPFLSRRERNAILQNDLLVFQPFGCQKARSTGSYIIRIPSFFVKREKSIFLNFYLVLYHRHRS
jgi:hypothetical protein